MNNLSDSDKHLAYHTNISASHFYILTLQRVRAFITRLQLKFETEKNFVKREPTPLLIHETNDEIIKDLNTKLNALIIKFPVLSELKNPICNIVKNLSLSFDNGLLLLNEYHLLLDLELKWLSDETQEENDFIEISANKNSVTFTILNGKFEFPEINEAITIQNDNGIFLSKIIGINQISRINNEKKTIEQFAAIEAGYYRITKGAQIPPSYQGLGISGFRDFQTYLSIADPGEGHVNVTSRHLDLLKGSVIHIEHIDRDKEADKEIIEPYRLPALINASKVRLHLGNYAPCTAFIGRPIFENYKLESNDKLFLFDLLKTSHLMSSTCSAFFSFGIADCKIGIERMTFLQAITFMKAIVGNVIRDEDTQYLSAAFNINTPIIDDRADNPIKISNPFKIALTGIQIASQGGFNKIAWDGASNQIPSIPIIEQLTHKQLVELVHSAHEIGLETYISAGMVPRHMEFAVYTGVDGVGIGTSLHYVDPETKLMGALKPESIVEVLKIRDKAENSVLGKSAKALAKLDRMFFEQLLTEEQNRTRLLLFEQLKNRNISLLEKTLTQLPNIENIPTGGHPIIQQAQRFIFCAHSEEFAPDESERILNDVSTAIENEDVYKIKQFLKIQRDL